MTEKRRVRCGYGSGNNSCDQPAIAVHIVRTIPDTERTDEFSKPALLPLCAKHIIIAMPHASG